MAKPKKLIIAAAAVAGLLVLAVIAVLFTEFDSPRLGQLALGEVGKASGFDLKAEGFRLNLLRGLELEGVEARATDGGMTASVDKLVLKHRPADLLGGTLTVTEILIESPKVELTDDGEATVAEPQPAPANAEPAAEAEGGEAEGGDAEATSLDLAIQTIRLENGHVIQRTTSEGITETTEVRGLEVEIHDLQLGAEPADGTLEAGGRGEVRIAEVVLTAGEETTTISDVEVDLDQLTLDRGLALAGTSMQGKLRLAEVVSATPEATETLVEKLAGRLALEAGGFRLDELEINAPQGVFQGEITADVGADPLTYTLDLHGDALDTAVLLGLGVPQERGKRNTMPGLGTSTFKLQASGESSDLARVAGKGGLTINGGELPDHPALAQVEQLLGNVALIGAGYETFPLEFDIRSHRIHLAPTKLTAGPVSLTLGGWVDFDGPLEMKLTVLAPQEGLRIKEIPAEVLAVLAEDDGRINLPMLLTGTADGSKVGLNQEYLKQLGKRYARKRVENELGKALSGLFGDN